jgi:membrane metallo-endopeptidase-like protein 1
MSTKFFFYIWFTGIAVSISVRWVSENKKEQPLAGLPYTPLQMFWISYSQLWCSKYHDSALKELILTDYHSPGEFRVIGPLSNNEDFARDFNCPLGSKMNPVDKCSVW